MPSYSGLSVSLSCAKNKEDKRRRRRRGCWRARRRWRTKVSLLSSRLLSVDNFKRLFLSLCAPFISFLFISLHADSFPETNKKGKAKKKKKTVRTETKKQGKKTKIDFSLSLSLSLTLTLLAPDPPGLALHLLLLPSRASSTTAGRPALRSRAAGPGSEPSHVPAGSHRLEERVQPSLLRLRARRPQARQRAADAPLVKVLLADEELDDPLDVRLGELDRRELVERGDTRLCVFFVVFYFGLFFVSLFRKKKEINEVATSSSRTKKKKKKKKNFSHL